LHPLSPDKAAPTRPLKRGEAGMLPVRSARLSPGREMRRALRMPGWMKPVFLIGDDEESRRWLKAHAPRLKAMGAVGLVVQVETVEALARLRALAGLPLSPVSGDDLAERLNLRHYPVLISAAGIEP
jgi:integrating conjugative element protein (TIGR03765 family)